MDGQRFDDLTRALVTSDTRRQFLRRVAGTVAGGALAAVGVRNTAAQGTCERGEVRCPTSASGCANLRTDPENCGRCGRSCNGDVCYAGRCLAECPRGFDACKGTCFRSCATGQSLDEACSCVCVPTTCAAEGVTCGIIADGCGDTIDCGECDENEHCANGLCEACFPLITSCDHDSQCCSGVCDLYTGTCRDVRHGCDLGVDNPDEQCPGGICCCCTSSPSGDEIGRCFYDTLNNNSACGAVCEDITHCGNMSQICVNGECVDP